MLCGSLLELGAILLLNDPETNVKTQQSDYLEAKYKEMRGGLRLFHNPAISKTPLYCKTTSYINYIESYNE